MYEIVHICGILEIPKGPRYLVLTDGVLFQKILVTATDFQDVFALIFLHAHL